MFARRVASVTGLLFAALCLFSNAQPIANDPSVAAALELARTWVEAQRAYERIPGVSAAIIHDQEVLWAGGFGLADASRIGNNAASQDSEVLGQRILKALPLLALHSIEDGSQAAGGRGLAPGHEVLDDAGLQLSGRDPLAGRHACRDAFRVSEIGHGRDGNAIAVANEQAAYDPGRRMVTVG